MKIVEVPVTFGWYVLITCCECLIASLLGWVLAIRLEKTTCKKECNV